MSKNEIHVSFTGPGWEEMTPEVQRIVLGAYEPPPQRPATLRERLRAAWRAFWRKP